MYTLFNTPSVVSFRKSQLPRFEIIKDVHRKNLERVISHYRTKAVRGVESDHLLVQLLQHIPVSVTEEPQLYIDKVGGYVDELTRLFKLTSPINLGEAKKPGVFYGKDTTEIILVTTEKFNYKENWENLSPIRFLSHPKTDFNLTVPVGKTTSLEEGLVVVLLNLPMLAYQYKEWRLRELKENPEFPRTIMQFVATYPLVNSLTSQLDVAYLNRTFKIFSGKNIPAFNDNHPFFLNTQEVNTNLGLKQLMELTSKRKLGFVELLEMLEPISANSFREVIAIPSMPFTRQVNWALFASRLNLIHFLLFWEFKTMSNKSRKEINEIRLGIKRLRSDRSIGELIGNVASRDIWDFLDNDIGPLLK